MNNQSTPSNTKKNSKKKDMRKRNNILRKLFKLPIVLSNASSSSSEFFTSVLADDFSLEFEWQQVSLSLQDSSQDSGRS